MLYTLAVALLLLQVVLSSPSGDNLQQVLGGGGLDSILRQYDRQIDEYINGKSTPPPSTKGSSSNAPSASDKALSDASNALKDVADTAKVTETSPDPLVKAVEDTNKQELEKVQQYYLITSKAVDILKSSIHQQHDQLRSYALALQSFHAKQSQFVASAKSKAEHQFEQMKVYSKKLREEIESFQTTLSSAKARVKEYSSALHPKQTPSQILSMDTYQLQSNLQQAQIVYSQVAEAIGSRKQMLAQIKQWVSTSRRELDAWTYSTTEKMLVQEKQGKSTLLQLQSNIENLHNQFKQTFQLKHTYETLLRRLKTQSDAIQVEKRLQRIKSAHEALSSALRVAKRQSLLFGQQEKDLQARLKSMDGALDDFKGEPLDIPHPPEYLKELTGMTENEPVITKPIEQVSQPAELPPMESHADRSISSDSKYPPLPPKFPPIPALPPLAE